MHKAPEHTFSFAMYDAEFKYAQSVAFCYIVVQSVFNFTGTKEVQIQAAVNEELNGLRKIVFFIHGEATAWKVQAELCGLLHPIHLVFA